MDHFGRNKFRRPFTLPWLSLAGGAGKDSRRPFILWGLFGRIKATFGIKHYDSLSEFLFTHQKKGKSSPKSPPTMTFFEDDYGIRILEALLKMNFQKIRGIPFHYGLHTSFPSLSLSH